MEKFTSVSFLVNAAIRTVKRAAAICATFVISINQSSGSFHCPENYEGVLDLVVLLLLE